MSVVHLLPQGSGPVAEGEMVALRVLDATGAMVLEDGVAANQWARVALLAGSYFARVTFASGRTSQTRFSVDPAEGGDRRILIPAPRSIHEWAGTATDRGYCPPKAEWASGEGRSRAHARRPDIWLRMWRRDPAHHPPERPFGDPWMALTREMQARGERLEARRKRERKGLLRRGAVFRPGAGAEVLLPPDQDFHVVPWPASMASYDHGIWALTTLLPERVQRVAQLGGGGAPWRMVVLPPSPTGLFVSTPRVGPGAGEDFRVGLASRESQEPAESVLAFFASGALDSARLAGEGLLRSSSPLGSATPVTQAVAGLYLLRSGDRARLGVWPREAAEASWWMPDLHVVRGWAHLLASPPEREEARASFLMAAAVGLPVFTQALRLLVDGLEILEEWQPDLETETALNEVGRIADAADWTQVFTTFYGTSPREPRRTSPTGVPLDATHLHFLPEGEADWVPFPEPPGSVPARPLIRVVPDPLGWNVERDGAAFAAFRTKREALDLASALARGHAPTRLVIHRRDGVTQAIRGFDPDVER